MRNAVLAAWLLAAPVLAQEQGATATEDPVAGFVADVPALMKRFRVPGAGVALVRDGKVVLARGFGKRSVAEDEPVDADTLFAIGSTSKAFTALAVGLLVEEGKLALGKPLRDYLPEFRLHDAYATAQATAEDLLTHRSGLPRHDFAWYGATATRAELFGRLRHLPPSEPFRAAWQYQNLMFMTAGLLVGRLSGASWEAYTRERILEPLGMKRTNFSVEASKKEPNHATPYSASGSGVSAMAFRNIDAVGPAGSINSTARDMARWLLLHVGDGAVGEVRVAKASTVRDQRRPRIVIPRPPSDEELGWTSYALGWMVRSYRGRNVAFHGGNIDGFSAHVAVLPDARAGVVVLTNLNRTPAPAAIAYRAYDALLGLEPLDWAGRMQLARKKQSRANTKRLREIVRGKKRGTKPSHPLRDYAGRYVHPGYGSFEIARQGGALVGRFNGIRFALEHYHYDEFLSLVGPIAGRRLRFFLDDAGDVGSFEVGMDRAGPKIRFVRAPREGDAKNG